MGGGWVGLFFEDRRNFHESFRRRGELVFAGTLMCILALRVVAEHIHKISAARHRGNIFSIERLKFFEVVEDLQKVGQKPILFARVKFDAGKFREMLEILLVDGGCHYLVW